jgi:hypothetical protein
MRTTKNMIFIWERLLNVADLLRSLAFPTTVPWHCLFEEACVINYSNLIS